MKNIAWGDQVHEYNLKAENVPLGHKTDLTSVA